MTNKNFGFGTQIRKSPYFDSTVKWGATGFSVYNHMYIPRDFGDPEQNFWNLIEKSILGNITIKIGGSEQKIGRCAVGQMSDRCGDNISAPGIFQGHRNAEGHTQISCLLGPG